MPARGQEHGQRTRGEPLTEGWRQSGIKFLLIASAMVWATFVVFSFNRVFLRCEITVVFEIFNIIDVSHAVFPCDVHSNTSVSLFVNGDFFVNSEVNISAPG